MRTVLLSFALICLIALAGVVFGLMIDDVLQSYE
jgi:hypothetical protein